MVSESSRRAVLALAWTLAFGACGGGTTASTVEGAPEPVRRAAIALRFVETIDDDPASTPTSRVVLVRIIEHEGRRTFDLGLFPGVCHNEIAPPPLLLRARCGWRGEVAGVSVRRVDGGVLVRRLGALGPSFDGDTELVRVDLPEPVVLEALGPPTLPVGAGLSPAAQPGSSP